MFAFRLLLSALVLILLLFGSESSSSSGSYHDRSGSALTRLFNSGVQEAERVRRPLGSRKHAVGVLSHTGVRVTLDDGSRWLVHKGKTHGRAGGETVVTSADHMSSRWKVIQSKNFNGRKTVSDFVKAGGSKYNVLSNNCHHASRRMMRQRP